MVMEGNDVPTARTGWWCSPTHAVGPDDGWSPDRNRGSQRCWRAAFYARGTGAMEIEYVPAGE